MKFHHTLIVVAIVTASAAGIDECGPDCDMSLLQVGLQQMEDTTFQVGENHQVLRLKANLSLREKCDDYATKLKVELDKEQGAVTNKGALKSSLASGVAGTLAMAVNGGLSTDVAAFSYSAAVDIVGTVVGMANPMLGMVVTMTMTVFSGIFFKSPSNPTQDLYDAIMSSVEELIKQNNLRNQMTAVKNDILGITEELSWVPDLVEAASTDVTKSYYLTVQHDLATGARTAFGDCFDDLSSGSCKSWQEAGTIEISLDYAQLHLEVLNSLYAIDSSEDFLSLLRTKMTSVGTKYKCLLESSYEAYKAYRTSGSRFDVKISTSAPKKARSKNKKCTWSLKIKDNLLNQEIKSASGSSQGKDEKYCKKIAKNKRNELLDAYISDLNNDLEAQFGDTIDALFDGFLTGTDASDPCKSSGLSL